MNKFVFIILFFVSFGLYAKDLPEVDVEKIISSLNYDSVFYSGRLEPKDTFIIYAPLAGNVQEIFVSEGMFVNKGDNILSILRKSTTIEYKPTMVTTFVSGIIAKINFSKGGEVFEKNELVTIADVSTYNLSLLLSDKDITDIKVGDPCFLSDDKNVKGIISKKSFLADAKTGLFKVEITFEKNQKLFIGKFITVELRTNFFKGITLPIEFVINKYGNNYVYIAQQGKVKMQEIKTGKSFGSKITIVKGLNEGDLLIVKSEINLSDGDSIKIKEKQKFDKKKVDNNNAKTNP